MRADREEIKDDKAEAKSGKRTDGPKSPKGAKTAHKAK